MAVSIGWAGPAEWKATVNEASKRLSKAMSARLGEPGDLVILGGTPRRRLMMRSS